MHTYMLCMNIQVKINVYTFLGFKKKPLKKVNNSICNGRSIY